MVNGNEPRELVDNAQFEAIYTVYRARIYRTIRGIVLDAEIAEDLAQDTFLRTFRWLLAHDSTNVEALLHRIAVNLSISYLRRQRLARMLPFRLRPASQPSAFDKVEARTVATKALTALKSPKLRAVVVLHFYGDMTREEIASILGIPSGTVASRMAAALTAMRSVLEEERPCPKGAEDAG